MFTFSLTEFSCLVFQDFRSREDALRYKAEMDRSSSDEMRMNIEEREQVIMKERGH
jgi:hypothetical protein